MHAVLSDIITEVIGLAKGGTFIDAGAGHQDGETARVVIASVVGLGEGALRIDGASEFTTPNNQGIIEQPPLFEVAKEAGRRLVGVVTLAFDGLGEAAMVIPAHVEELDEAHVAFAETTSQKAIRGIRAGAFYVWSVKVEDVLWFFGKIEQVRYAGLHAEGHFILCNPSLDFGIAEDIVTLAIEGGELVELFAAYFAGDAVGVLKIKHAFALIAELNPLEFGGQETGAPESVVERLIFRSAAAE